MQPALTVGRRGILYLGIVTGCCTRIPVGCSRRVQQGTGTGWVYSTLAIPAGGWRVGPHIRTPREKLVALNRKLCRYEFLLFFFNNFFILFYHSYWIYLPKFERWRAAVRKQQHFRCKMGGKSLQVPYEFLLVFFDYCFILFYYSYEIHLPIFETLRAAIRKIQDFR